MSVFIDTKYINLISSKLEKFSWKSSTMAICRCPLCGDSKKNKTKRRFYFYQEEGTFYVKCHNCQYAFYFSVFLKQFDGNLYRQYCLETFGKNKDEEKSPSSVKPRGNSNRFGSKREETSSSSTRSRRVSSSLKSK